MSQDFWTLHAEDWLACTRCTIGAECIHTVLFDGIGEWKSSPEVLLIGEAPGTSEDGIGKPFVGPSGRLLREGLIEAGWSDVATVFTNIVACKTPRRPPELLEIGNCQPRLRELLDYVQPIVLVTLGEIARASIPELLKHTDCQPPVINMLHPAYLLRHGGKKADGYTNWIRRFRKIREDLRNGVYNVED